MFNSDIPLGLPMPKYAPRPKPTIIPTAAWNDTPLFCLIVNDEWVSHILGVLEALDQPDTWIGTEAEIQAAKDNVNEIMLALMTKLEDILQYPQHATLWHDEATIISGGGLTRSSLNQAPYNVANGFYNTLSYQSSAANGDSFSQTMMLEAGDYNFFALGANNSSHGKVDWYLDSEASPFISGQDWYNATLQANIIKSGTVTVSYGGRHTLTGIVNGRNAGNSLAYALPLTKYWFEYVP